MIRISLFIICIFLSCMTIRNPRSDQVIVIQDKKVTTYTKKNFDIILNNSKFSDALEDAEVNNRFLVYTKIPIMKDNGDYEFRVKISWVDKGGEEIKTLQFFILIPKEDMVLQKQISLHY